MATPAYSLPSQGPQVVVSEEMRLRLLQLAAEDLKTAVTGPLMDFIPWAFPNPVKHPTSGRIGPMFAPTHLKPIVDVLERIFDNEYMRVAFSVPPQTGKTSSVQASLARGIIRDPTARVGYGSYTQARAGKISAGIRDIVERAGIPTRGGIYNWTTAQGGGVQAGGIDHGFTGNPYEVVVIDDPYDGRDKAESDVYQAAVENWIVSTLETRCRVIVLVHTRWAPGDCIGRRLHDPEWNVINLPAICDEVDEETGVDILGRSLGDLICPELWPMSVLAKKMATPYEWASLYQGRPQPKGTEVFSQPSTYTSIPEASEHVRIRHSAGFDVALTVSTRSDWSTLVVVTRADFLDPQTKKVTSSIWYVRAVLRMQKRSLDFADDVKKFLMAGWKGVPLFIYQSSTDMSTVDHMKRIGLPVRPLSIGGRDKLTRSLNCAAEWNMGNVRVPEDASWLVDFLDELRAFTGSGVGHDDQVDSLVTAFDSLNFVKTEAYSPVGSVRSMGAPMDTYAGGRRVDPQEVKTGGANGAVYPREPTPPSASGLAWGGRGRGF